MSFGDDSLVYAMRVTYDQAEQDVRSAFTALSKQAGSVTIGAAVSSGAAQQVDVLVDKRAQELALMAAERDILAAERALLDEILRLQVAGLETSQAKMTLYDKEDLALAQQEKRLGEVVRARKIELGLQTEIARTELQTLREKAGAAGLSGAQKESLLVSELKNEQARLGLVMQRAEAALEKEITLARKFGIDVSEAQLVLDQRRAILAQETVRDARDEAVARQLALQAEQVRLSVLNKQYALAHAQQRAQTRDAMGKSFGGLRGVMPIRDFDDLAKSFSTAEALKARTLSLFAGQIGTLALYAAGFAAVSTAYSVVITRNVELQKEMQRLSVVVDSETGSQGEALRELRDAAINWSEVHGRKIAELVRSYYELGAAGLATADILQGAFSSLLLSEGGFIDQAAAVELLQSQYQTFARAGNSFIDLANIIQTTAAESAVTVEDLAVAMKYSAASAQTANTSFEELNALLGTLGNLGLRGSIAGTSLNQVFTQLAKKRSEIEELGITVVDTSGQMRSFIDILEDFKQVFGTTISAGEQEILKDLFDVRGARAMERLIQDTTNLPRLLDEVEGSSVAAFTAAEKGANTASEAVKVLGNQIANLFLIGKLPDFFRDFFDSMSNRVAGRALQNIQSGSKGAEFELGRLDATMLQSGYNAKWWALRLAAAGQDVDGELGDKLRQLRKDSEGFLSGGFRGVGMDAYADQLAAFNMSDETLENWRLFIVEMQRAAAAKEGLVKGESIIKAVFGQAPGENLTGDAANAIVKAAKETQRAYAQMQVEVIQRRLEMFEGMLDIPVETEKKRLTELLLFWEGAVKDLGSADVAVTQEQRRQEEALAKAKIATRESELRLLQTAAATEYDERKRAIALDRDLRIEQRREELKIASAALDKEYDDATDNFDAIQRRRLELEQQAQNDINGIRNSSAQQMRDIDLAALDEMYGARERLRAQEKKLLLESADAGRVSGIERQFAQDAFLARGNQLVAELEAGGITLQRFSDEFALAEGEYELALQRITKAERAREVALLELGGEVALSEARLLVGRVDAWTAFENARQEISARYLNQRAVLDLQYADDEAMLILKQKELWVKTQSELTALNLSEEDKRREAALDSMAMIGQSFGQLSELMQGLSEDTTATMLAGLSRTVDAAGNVVNILDRMKNKTLGGPAGVLGIVGIAASLLGSFLTRRRDEEDQARLLADEFREVSGRTPTADFGRAQVVNVRMETTVNYRSLGKPTLIEQKEIADAVVDEVVDELQQRGYVGG